MDSGIIFFGLGMILAGVVIGFVFSDFLAVQIQTSDDQVLLIAKAWEGCWLAVGLDDMQLYWKCDGFSVPIDVYVCSKETAIAELEQAKKRG